jgi:hypothetical protein
MSDLPIACTLSAHELACGAAELLPGLAAVADAVRPRADGVRLKFAGETGLVTRLAAVIERERQCCQFLRFQLEVTPGLGPVTLDVDGPPGTGAFLAGLHPSFAAPVA